ncbi:uncharacterized protein [Cicer arietinum]|uniref:Uncharacterized protein LOC113786252 n=1 Tax=Cicer arietinum TaxID=3827 RepID=A0A3Q7YER0_CICAR|nr:uncharacterized protein LOC113786252 [Cicer arietinum]
MEPYEALYGRKCQTPLCLYKDVESMIVGHEMVQQATYKITSRIGPVAYRIALPPILSYIHNVFHMSQLRKYILDPSHVIEPGTVQLKDNLSVELVPIRIEDMKIKRLRNKEVLLVKVIWNLTTGDPTWELEGKMRE